MTYQLKMRMLVIIDAFIIAVSVFLSYYFRFQGNIPEANVRQMVIFIIFYLTIGLLIMRMMKLYNRIWQYASIYEMLAIFKAVTIGCVITYILTTLISGRMVPLSVILLTYETNLLLMGAVRFIWRILKGNVKTDLTQKNTNIMVIGAGNCATFIIKELAVNKASGMKAVVLIDDDRNKHQMHVHGIPVHGGRNLIHEAAIKYDIDEIIIAIPSAPRAEIQQLIDICKQTKAKLKIIPKLNDFITGKVTLKEIRDVDVEDLLGRDPIQVDLQGIANYVEHKTVLVTGAGGSIGSELCRQLAPFHPKQLLLLGHGENSIYRIEMELLRLFPTLPLETIIADIQDEARINQVFEMYRPDVVFHAAAHKHVPMMERNPAEAIKNNVWGTRNVARAADRYLTERFVLISSDKAVNPTSIMGATKRIAEMVISAMNEQSQTRYVAVRFGNVLGSNGSVIPRFKEQISYGGPVTVTHPEMTRYFMTIPEAVQLVIQAGSYARGGELFILDMGNPVKIVDLARDLIRFSGFEPDEDIAIVYTGIRPGEKLYEELLTDAEGISSTLHNRIFIGQPEKVDSQQLETELHQLEQALVEDESILRERINTIINSNQGSSYIKHIS